MNTVTELHNRPKTHHGSSHPLPSSLPQFRSPTKSEGIPLIPPPLPSIRMSTRSSKPPLKKQS